MDPKLVPIPEPAEALRNTAVISMKPMGVIVESPM
jgi:hypothetical protein